MKRLLVLFAFAVALLALAGCGGNATLGMTTIDGKTFTVTALGPFAAGTATNFDVHITGGRGTITALRAWVGTMDGAGSMMATGNYDPEDSTYEVNVTAPSPLPSGSRFWIAVDDNSATQTGSVPLP